MSHTTDLIATANKCLEAGISVMPITIYEAPHKDTGEKKWHKLPVIKWKHLQSERLTSGEIVEHYKNIKKANGIGIVCGKISGDPYRRSCLEVIDVDTKHDDDGTIWNDLTTAIAHDDRVSGLYKDLVIATTVNKGYHLIYRYEYDETREPKSGHHLAESKDGNGIIETMSQGNYIVAYPTPGYSILQGDFEDIPLLTQSERDVLHEICKRFHFIKDTPVTAPQPQGGVKRTTAGKLPGEDYDAQTSASELADLLERHGWTINSPLHHDRISVLRPDNGSAATSATSGNIFSKPGTVPLLSVFSSNAAPFEVDKPDGSKRAYTPFACYTLLEHAGDYKAAARALRKDGYGDPMNPAKEIETPTGVTIYKQNHSTRERIEIAAPGAHIHATDLREMSGYRIVIHAPGTPHKEILPAINLIHASGKACFVDDGTGELVFGCRIVLSCIISKYAGSEDEGLSDIEISDFEREIAEHAAMMPQDQEDKFIKDATDYTKEIGISYGTIKAAKKKIRAIKDEQRQAARIEEAMHRGSSEQNPGKRLDGLLNELLEIKRKAGTASLDEINRTLTYDDLFNVFSKGSTDIPTGYQMNDPGSKEFFELHLPAGALSVIAGRTSHRKTGLCMNICLNVATKRQVSGDVYFFSYEESREVIYLKFLSLHSETPLIGVNNDKPSSRPVREFKKYYQENGQVNDKGKNIDRLAKRFENDVIKTGRLKISEPRMKITELCRAIMQLKDHGNPGLIAVDYLQLLRHEEAGSKSRQAELMDVCEALREVAVTTGLPILLAAQFNRDVKQEEDIESYHIRESGDIEQTANLVIGIWDRAFSRERKSTGNGAGGKDKPPLQRQRNGEPAKPQPGKLYVEVLKGRDIGTGAWSIMNYTGQTGKIYSWTPVLITSEEETLGSSNKPKNVVNRPHSTLPQPTAAQDQEPTPTAAQDDDDLPPF
jgi:replicative DNA helicase